MLWVLSLNIETFRNERGSLRRWKNMNDHELLKDLLTHSGVESGSEVEGLDSTILLEQPDET
jgi:hypothetical protein